MASASRHGLKSMHIHACKRRSCALIVALELRTVLLLVPRLNQPQAEIHPAVVASFASCMCVCVCVILQGLTETRQVGRPRLCPSGNRLEPNNDFAVLPCGDRNFGSDISVFTLSLVFTSSHFAICLPYLCTGVSSARVPLLLSASFHDFTTS